MVETPRPTLVDEGGVVSMDVDFGQHPNDQDLEFKINSRHLRPRIAHSRFLVIDYSPKIFEELGFQQRGWLYFFTILFT